MIWPLISRPPLGPLWIRSLLRGRELVVAAALRLAGITVLKLAYEVSPGRYRPALRSNWYCDLATTAASTETASASTAIASAHLSEADQPAAAMPFTK